MSWFDVVWHLVSPFAGAAVAFAAVHIIGEQRWQQVRSIALGLLGDSDKPAIDDGKKAVEAALIQSQLERVAVEAQRVQEAFRPNGVRPQAK